MSDNNTVYLSTKQHTVMVHIHLPRFFVFAYIARASIGFMAEKFDHVIAHGQHGEFGGLEDNGKDCVLYFHGPNADAIWAIIQPVLSRRLKGYKGFVRKKYGSEDDPNAYEQLTHW
ncbi:MULTISPECIES: hypothetical protein [Asticcacaulis]|uniref:hypothetical protein n=1 Tax=Asticcacaulis TaxID=76890 RepID=UPI001AE4B11E|nr:MULTISPECIES: hypothetical protein [Asticcacaulis]MBP2158281.1 hypothetical protein [Asticcacaulis solisilvae]MDR6799326.1 hypothetical protein [Asticcacaulis sp. BE141]